MLYHQKIKISIKVISMFIMIFVLCGCNIDYKLSINQDDTIDVIAKIKSKDSTEVETIEYAYKEYYQEEISKNNYNVSNKSNKNKFDLTLSKKYNNIDEYMNSTDSYDLSNFGNLSCEVSKCELSFVFDNPSVFFTYIAQDIKPIDDLSITLNIPYNVLYNNADAVSGNNYTWNYNIDNNDKAIRIVYDKEISKEIVVNIGKDREIKITTLGAMNFGISIVILVGCFSILYFVIRFIKKVKNNNIPKI